MPAIAPLPHHFHQTGVADSPNSSNTGCCRSIWLLCGGPSSEYPVSLGSARSVLANFPYDRWCVRLVCWAPPVGGRGAGSWLLSPHAFFETPDDALLDATFAPLERPADYPLQLSAAQMLAQLEADEPEAALNVMHGTGGEDGVIQGFFQVAGVPMTGSGVAASALAMDKAKARRVLAEAGLRPARGFTAGAEVLAPTLEGREQLDALGRKIGAELGLPVIVKPAVGGSSFGLTLLRELGGLEQALRLALVEAPEGQLEATQTELARGGGAENGAVLIEEFLPGREFTCGVLEIRGALQPLAVTEIIPGGDGDLFDYESKYTAGAAREITPAAITWELTQEMQRQAVAAHRALGCAGYSRTDFRMDGPISNGPIDDSAAERGAAKCGIPRVLETNTLPGMTGTSLLPQGAAAAGITFPQLLTLMIEAATGSHIKRVEPKNLAATG